MFAAAAASTRSRVLLHQCKILSPSSSATAATLSGSYRHPTTTLLIRNSTNIHNCNWDIRRTYVKAFLSDSPSFSSSHGRAARPYPQHLSSMLNGRLLFSTSPSKRNTTDTNKNDAAAVQKTEKSKASTENQVADIKILRTLAGYLWMKDNPEFRLRVLTALAFLVGAKVLNVQVPFLFKLAVDWLTTATGNVFTPPNSTALALFATPAAVLIGYGIARSCASAFNELRNAVFSKVALRTIRSVSRKVFSHLLDLDLQYHLSRETGALHRIIDRGSRAINFILSSMVFNIVPTILEIGLLGGHFSWLSSYYMIILVATSFSLNHFYRFNMYPSRYLWYQWRTKFRKAMNKADNDASTRAIDSLINYETVKYFNEAFEVHKYQLKDVYRETIQSLVDMKALFQLLELMLITPSDIEILLSSSVKLFCLKFFLVASYLAGRKILDGVSFIVPAGKSVAIVGTSGSGKSTILRLLFRFFDTSTGSISVDGQDIREVSLQSLRKFIGVVPQDTVLFNDTIFHNIHYGCLSATKEEVYDAARRAAIHETIMNFPEKYSTVVGERGLKLSGGEKQRVALARAFLKASPIMLCDEATSALDSTTEAEVLNAMKSLANNRTSVFIAHRLTTAMQCDEIIVLENGKVIEHGSHDVLLSKAGRYAQLWGQQNNTVDALDSAIKLEA
ncbi:ABC transporter B family member 25 [Morella rubra]|uniref:ABC transporter B family member 25 n=1 Tax=Morella rubra TaxID=262757 RepID=A0A6A1UL86_9ROSI|nr:ABC transporter B family member 25 [Morella rubra]